MISIRVIIMILAVILLGVVLYIDQLNRRQIKKDQEEFEDQLLTLMDELKVVIEGCDKDDTATRIRIEHLLYSIKTHPYFSENLIIKLRNIEMLYKIKFGSLN